MVTTTNQDNEVTYWTWRVNPLTRMPIVPPEDVLEIQELLDCQYSLVFSNSKFDIRMLEFVGLSVDWDKVHDILISSHLLESSKPKDLPNLAKQYLNIDIESYESKLEKTVKKAQKVASDKFPGWRIAKRGDEMLPSVKEKLWKNDLWLPAELRARLRTVPASWEGVVEEYANADSQVTMLIHKVQMDLIYDQGLEKLYHHRLKCLKPYYDMENRGITLNGNRLEEQQSTYEEDSRKSGTVCNYIARSKNYDLTLPKSGNNNSLMEFVFGINPSTGEPSEHNCLDLPVVKLTRAKKPSLDSKTVLPHYLDTLPLRSPQGRFVEHLARKRKRDTAISYMESYRRFMLPIEGKVDWYVLHPSVNPTGTATLRSSSKNPNEQNISKKKGFNLRYIFGPAPGREWWSLDYNNLELRIPAYECQEPAMLELFEHPDDPPYYGSYHLLIFSILYPDLFKKHGASVKDHPNYKSTLYQWTKNGNFAELYGAIDTYDGNSTADRAFHYPGAQQMVASRLTKKTQLNQYYIEFARTHGYVETLPDRTVDPDRGYPLHFRRDFRGRISPTVPLNYHVQGTACWIKSQALVKCTKYLQKINSRKGRQYYIIMDVHDELVFDFPKVANQGNLPIIREIQKLMESCGDDVGIKLTVGIDHNPNNWSESIAI